MLAAHALTMLLPDVTEHRLGQVYTIDAADPPREQTEKPGSAAGEKSILYDLREATIEYPTTPAERRCLLAKATDGDARR